MCQKCRTNTLEDNFVGKKMKNAFYLSAQTEFQEKRTSHGNHTTENTAKKLNNKSSILFS